MGENAMKPFILWLIGTLVILAVTVVIIVLVISAVGAIFETVQTEGLKNILDGIWEGTK